MTSYLYAAPAGVPGDVTRIQESNVEPILLGEDFPAFGVPYKLDASTGKAMVIDSGDAATVFQGVISRSVPSISGNLTQGYNDAIPNANASIGGLVRGYINVLCKQGTPVKGGQVFMRVTADTGKLVGDFETTADGGACVALSNVQFSVNGKDSNNITEIRVFK